MGNGLLREDIAAVIFALLVGAGTVISKIIAFMGPFALAADLSADIALVGGCIPIKDSIYIVYTD